MKWKEICLATLLLSACSEADQTRSRTKWLQSTIVTDNLDVAFRDQALLEKKFLKMGMNSYRFFRGTAAQYLRDATESGPAAFPTTYGSKDSLRVQLVGDPHLENIGTYRTREGTMRLEYNDFDSAIRGPYHFDVRRLALSFEIAFGHQENMLNATKEVGLAYAQEIERIASGSTDIPMCRTQTTGRILEDLLQKAEKEGFEREELYHYTEVVDGKRQMLYGDIESAEYLLSYRIEADTVSPVTTTEYQMVERLIANWRETVLDPGYINVASTKLKGVSRRLGAGVSSYPNLRYYALLEGPFSSVDDDWLIELKEVRDPPFIPSLPIDPGLTYATNGERIVKAQRSMHQFDDSDIFLGWANDGPLSFRLRSRSKFQKNLSLKKMRVNLDQGAYVEDDFMTLARVTACLLAHSQTAIPLPDGRSSALAIQEAIGGDFEGFGSEIQNFVQFYSSRVRTDYAIYRQLLEDHGPFLGIQLGDSLW